MKSKRLNQLVDLIPRCDVLADVGCDHGYVGIEALLRNIAQRVLFVDVSEMSLKKARDNTPDDVRFRCKYICRDGLGELEADCAVIAGMGGLEIISILSNAKFLPQTLILQPNRNQKDVRKYLETRYTIDYDRMMYCGGIFYNMIVAVRTDRPVALNELELEFGKTNFVGYNKDFYLYLDKEQVKLKKILNDCNDPEVSAKLSLIERAIAVLGGSK